MKEKAPFKKAPLMPRGFFVWGSIYFSGDGMQQLTGDASSRKSFTSFAATARVFPIFSRIVDSGASHGAGHCTGRAGQVCTACLLVTVPKRPPFPERGLPYR